LIQNNDVEFQNATTDSSTKKWNNVFIFQYWHGGVPVHQCWPVPAAQMFDWIGGKNDLSHIPSQPCMWHTTCHHIVPRTRRWRKCSPARPVM
jgi:hypothetical protein